MVPGPGLQSSLGPASRGSRSLRDPRAAGSGLDVTTEGHCWECLHSAGTLSVQMDSSLVQGRALRLPSPSPRNSPDVPPSLLLVPSTPGVFPSRRWPRGPLALVQLDSPTQDLLRGVWES